jgi:hypothetical protein
MSAGRGGSVMKLLAPISLVRLNRQPGCSPLDGQTRTATMLAPRARCWVPSGNTRLPLGAHGERVPPAAPSWNGIWVAAQRSVGGGVTRRAASSSKDSSEIARDRPRAGSP